MADTKISAFTALTAPATTDVVPIVDDPGGTPLSRKVTVQNLVGYAVTTAGDILYATAARTLARLAKGTANQVLRMNSGATAPEWGLSLSVRYVQMVVTEFTTTNAVGNGQFYLHIPPELNGLNLTYVHGENITAGTTGVETVQIHNLTQTADMLSTELTIDSGETGSDTAAAPAVIDEAEDDVATNDVLRIDRDTVHTTPAEGLILTLGFSL